MSLFVSILFEVLNSEVLMSGKSVASLELPVSSVAGALRANWSSDETAQGLETTCFGSSILVLLYKESYRLDRSMDTGRFSSLDLEVNFTRPATSYQGLPSRRGAFLPLNQHS